jgi:uncharacterized protein DUF3152
VRSSRTITALVGSTLAVLVIATVTASRQPLPAVAFQPPATVDIPDDSADVEVSPSVTAQPSVVPQATRTAGQHLVHAARVRVAPTRTTPKPTASQPSGIGVWLVAPGGTGTVGPGTRGAIVYRVEVEQATGLSPGAVAAVVDATLDGSRGWINEGWSFRRVASGSVNLVVRVATPSTVDKECLKYGLHTGGVVSCRGGNYVNINLTRWTQGIPAYAGHVIEYDHLVVNHEVGHRLGHGHVGCPAPGAPAPVMMQQYYGLNGCQPNVWPYALDGRYLD